jgi:thymidylate synthase
MTFSAVLACFENGLMGSGDSLAHQSASEMAHFKKLTMNKTLIVGRGTWNPYIFPLSNRKHILISSGKKLQGADEVCNFKKATQMEGDFVVIGGASIYRQFIFANIVKTIHLSVLKQHTLKSDDEPVHLPFKIEFDDEYVVFCAGELKVLYKINNVEKNTDFTYYELEFVNYEDQYIAHILNVLPAGTKRLSRSGAAVSIFNRSLGFDVRHVFPLSSVRQQNFKFIAAELLFFLSGQTDTKVLEAQGINIWKKNTCREALDKLSLDYAEGEMGPSYGWQMRHFGAAYPDKSGGVDQLKELIEEIKLNPNSRRLIINLWNPVDLDKMALPPCLFMYQFIVRDGFIDVTATQRSSDFALAGAWNIAATALLLYIVAHVTSLEPGSVTWNACDIHMYENQMKQVEKTLETLDLPPFPRLVIEGPKNIDELKLEHFRLIGYNCQKKIHVEMNG